MNLHVIENVPLGLILAAVNLIWTVLNVKMQATFEKKMREEFCTRIECRAKHDVLEERTTEITRRLDRAGA